MALTQVQKMSVRLGKRPVTIVTQCAPPESGEGYPERYAASAVLHVMSFQEPNDGCRFLRVIAIGRQRCVRQTAAWGRCNGLPYEGDNSFPCSWASGPTGRLGRRACPFTLCRSRVPIFGCWPGSLELRQLLHRSAGGEEHGDNGRALPLQSPHWAVAPSGLSPFPHGI